MGKSINLNDQNKKIQRIEKNRSHIYKSDRIKKETGITIITLVVTILIIIILAGITINAALGDNGLLRQAQNAKDLAESTTLETGEKMNKVLQEYANIMAEDEGGGIQEPEEDTTPPTVQIAEGAITQNSITINVTANDTESGLASEKPYIYYLNGAEYERSNSSSCTFTGLTESTMYTIKVEVYNGAGIKGEDSITIITDAIPGLNANEIQQNPSVYYGKEVTGYTTGHNETNGAVTMWRIFYADESNIYLIADDFIEPSDAPLGRENSVCIGTYESYPKGVMLSNANGNYPGGANWINSNSKARKWLSQFLQKYGTSTIGTVQATAYLMDTTVWNVYAGEYAEYAIGGSTIELFCASYQDTHPDRYIECVANSEYGYQVKWSDSSTYSDSVSGLDKNEFEGIYLKNGDGANGMWLASPSASGNEYLLVPTSSWGLTGEHYGVPYYGGLRPIVCLNENVRLVAQENGIYAIV